MTTVSLDVYSDIYSDTYSLGDVDRDRVVQVAAEDRTTVVAAEARTTVVAAESRTISTRTVTATGVTKDSDSETAGVVTVWLSGGTAGTAATVACAITTSAGRTDERTIRITIGER